MNFSGVDRKYHQRTGKTPPKHEILWNGLFGDINVAEHAKDLKDAANPFK